MLYNLQLKAIFLMVKKKKSAPLHISPSRSLSLDRVFLSHPRWSTVAPPWPTAAQTLASSGPPTSACQRAGITAVGHYTWPKLSVISTMLPAFLSCH